MKCLLPLALLVHVTGCATSGRAPAAPSWLVGTWLMPDQSTPFPHGCNSDQPIRYNADGTFAFADERGTWRLDGNRLTETLTEGGEPGEHGQAHVSQVIQTEPDAFAKSLETGAAVTFRRCPPQ
jgi:hypothetical protein